jgi:hypothetical protein
MQKFIHPFLTLVSELLGFKSHSHPPGRLLIPFQIPYQFSAIFELTLGVKSSQFWPLSLLIPLPIAQVYLEFFPSFPLIWMSLAIAIGACSFHPTKFPSLVLGSPMFQQNSLWISFGFPFYST